MPCVCCLGKADNIEKIRSRGMAVEIIALLRNSSALVTPVTFISARHLMGKNELRTNQRDLHVTPLILRGWLLKQFSTLFGKEKETTYEAINDF